jgi:hypothetical protein
MNGQFDQLAKGVAESVTRRQAFTRFAFGLAAMALSGFALSSKADRNCLPSGSPCGKPGQGGCGSCCSKSHFCQISADTGKQCFCN